MEQVFKNGEGAICWLTAAFDFFPEICILLRVA